MSNDYFSDLLDSFTKLAQNLMNNKDFEKEFFAVIPGEAAIEDQENEESGELIVGKDFVTFLLPSTGRDQGDFRVSFESGKLKIELDQSEIVENIEVPVDASSLSSSYNNGVLSVRLRRT
jgi:HSP20 family molecular chaperone IbpA